ncbi:MAG TPA: peptidyl-prolyl cis-trans isomerase [Polyangiaceae bacterium]|nr:peptidyl-prolyl cis-trans isomerase [Polyangiaceae bacterium]
MGALRRSEPRAESLAISRATAELGAPPHALPQPNSADSSIFGRRLHRARRRNAKSIAVRRFLFSFRRPLAVALFALGVGSAASRPARAAVIERVVAVIGDRAILLSDLKSRAQPFLIQVLQTVPPGAQRNAAISQVYKGVLDKIVDEELEERAAIQAKITITSKEIDEAVARVAQQNQLTPQKLIAEAAKTGITEQQYRDELRRQLLQAKLVNVRLQGRIRVTDEDLKLAYKKLVFEERQRLGLKVAWIRIPAAGDGSGRALAERIAEAARTEDFASLARQFSQDRATKDTGGVLPQDKITDLPPAIARASLGLEVGEASPPVRMDDDYVIVRVNSRDASQLPSFEDARRELGDRVYMDKMGQARRSWLDSLRRQNHVEVRL